MPFGASSYEIKSLTVKLSAVMDQVEMRLVQVSQQTLAASHTMAGNAQQARKIAQDTLDGALAEFRRAASDTVAGGMRDAIANYEQALGASEKKLAQTTSGLILQLREATFAHLATAWKAFIALSIAAIALMGVSGYLIWRAHNDMQIAQWGQEVNAATASGKLTRCPEGGLCAMVNKRWQRLDH